MRLTEKRDGKVVYCGPGNWAGNSKAGMLSKTAQQEILDKLWLLEEEQEENEMKKRFVFGDRYEDAQPYEIEGDGLE